MTSYRRPSSINETAVVELSYFWCVYQQAVRNVSSNSAHPFPVKSEQRNSYKRPSSWSGEKIETAEGSDLVSSVYLVFYWPTTLRLDEIALWDQSSSRRLRIGWQKFHSHQTLSRIRFIESLRNHFCILTVSKNTSDTRYIKIILPLFQIF